MQPVELGHVAVCESDVCADIVRTMSMSPVLWDFPTIRLIRQQSTARCVATTTIGKLHNVLHFPTLIRSVTREASPTHHRALRMFPTPVISALALCHLKELNFHTILNTADSPGKSRCTIGIASLSHIGSPLISPDKTFQNP